MNDVDRGSGHTKHKIWREIKKVNPTTTSTSISRRCRCRHHRRRDLTQTTKEKPSRLLQNNNKITFITRHQS